jgi:putative PEP-CTERM system TPR-repeat lipoprotein
MGDHRKAMTYMAKAAEANPKSESIAFKQALLQLEGGELDSAIAELTRSADAASEATRADALLILALVAKGDLDKALQAAEKLEKKAPRHVITHAMKGHVLSRRSDWKGARQAFEAALKLQPTYYPAAAQLAILDIRDGNASAARRRFESILAADEKNVNALMAIAQLDIRAGKLEDALTALTQAVRIAPQLLEPRVRQINLLIHMGEIARARSQAELAVQTFPDEPRALEVLTAVQMRSGEEESALSTASRRASLDRGSADAQLKLAATQFAAGDFKAAEASARQALKIDQRYGPAREFLVALLVNRNRAAEALSLARDIQKQHAKDPSGFALEGDVHAAQRAWPAAMEAYRKALALGAGSAVSVKLFRARYGAGDEAAAMEELERLIAKRPDDAVLRVEMADVLLQRGDPKSAAEHYAHVVKLVPGNAQLLNNLAWAYFQSRDARALATAEQAHALNRGDHRIADTLGWILVETGDAKRGLTLLEKAVAADPGNGNIRFHYASALAKTGEKKKARDELRRLLSSSAAFDLRKEAVALAEGLK